MAEKRRSGIPLRIQKGRLSYIGADSKHLSDHTMSNDIVSGCSSDRQNVLSCHTNVKIDESEHAFTTAEDYGNHPVVCNNVLTRSKANVNGVHNANKMPEASSTKFKPPTGHGTSTAHAISQKKESDVKFRTKQQLELELHCSQENVTKLKHVIQEKDRSYSEKENKLKQENYTIRKEMEAVQQQLMHFKTTLEQQGVDTVSLQSIVIDNQKIAEQCHLASDMAKTLADVFRQSTTSVKIMEQDLTEIIDDCSRVNGVPVSVENIEANDVA